MQDSSSLGAWFLGPKAENAEQFARMIQHIFDDYTFWRRNYFPDDGILLTAKQRREHEPFWDEFTDRLTELLARLKADFPFHSPRYAAHMLSEQALPAIAGYFAAMLYNPNNVTTEAAPVTVRLELEASRLLSEMMGYGDDAWAHLTSGGTVANLEALWAARQVRYLPLITRDVARAFEVNHGDLGDWQVMPPTAAMSRFHDVFRACIDNGATFEEVVEQYLISPYNPATQGIAAVWSRIGSEGTILVSEAAHYSLSKVADVLGIGRNNLVRIPVDHEFRMRTDALRDAIQQLVRSGGHVIAVVPTIGTTEEGAIDPMGEVCDARADLQASGLSSFWIHADAAYGGYLRTLVVPERVGLGEPCTTTAMHGELREIELILPHGAPCDALERLPEADSITVDPHKLGYVPYPCGAVCYRSNMVKPLLRQDAPYISDELGEPDRERSASSIGPFILEGSKPGAAAAALWLHHTLIPLRSDGLGVVIRQGVRSAAELHALLSHWGEWTNERRVRAACLSAPQSNIVCFAFRPVREVALHQINALNRAVYEAFTVPKDVERHIYDQRFFVSKTFMNARRYVPETLRPFLTRLGVTEEEYEREGVFLLRCTLMSPWYDLAKQSGRYYLADMVEELYCKATEVASELER
jgi:glutamate/tyrosine decarboxylase-like PLP-dependent enzyme